MVFSVVLLERCSKVTVYILINYRLLVNDIYLCDTVNAGSLDDYHPALRGGGKSGHSVLPALREGQK